MAGKRKKITYAQVGDDYSTKDPIKVLVQESARLTHVNLLKRSFLEITASRGEPAFVWKQGNVLMAKTIEGLGTQNLVADGVRPITGKSGYDIIGYNTVTTIVNDLVSVGARTLVVHAYWAIEDNSWLQDKERLDDLVAGWKEGCDVSGATWGGGETPTLKGIIQPNTIDLGGSAVGIVGPKRRYLHDEKLKHGDKIVLVKSTGVNTNGVSLVREVAARLPQGYATPLPNDKCFGEIALNKMNNYAKLVEQLLDNRIDVHYISNITGHGLRKIMRGRPTFTYVIEHIAEPPAIFHFIQEQSHLSDYEMYGTFNMGTDYAIFVSKRQVKPVQRIINECGFESIDAGYVEKGPKQVVIKPKSIVFGKDSLKLR